MKIEEIYPLTIIVMRFGKIALIEAPPYFDCIQSLYEDEEVQYDPESFMLKYYSDINYGIGETIDEAFINYQNRIIK